MKNQKSIQILRSSKTYNVNQSEEILLDGQPFYSKKNKQLYIGDGENQLKNTSPVTAFEHLNNNQVLSTACIPDGSNNIVDDKLLNSDGTSMSPVSNNSLIIGVKNKLNSGARSLIVGSGNQIDQDDLIGGSQNIVFGASNIVCASTGLTVGNGNKVGDATGNNYGYGTPNQVSNCIVSGYQNIVQNCARGSAIFGNANKVSESSSSIVAGQENEVSHAITSVFGYHLKTNAAHQHVVGVNNKIEGIKPNTVFMIGAGTAEERKNAIEVQRVYDASPKGCTTINTPTYVTEAFHTNDIEANSGNIINIGPNINVQGQINANSFKNSAISINAGNINFHSSANCTNNNANFLLPDVRCVVRLVGKQVADNYYNKTDLGFTSYNDFWNNSGAYTLQNRNEIAKLLTGQTLVRTKAQVDAGEKFKDLSFDDFNILYKNSDGSNVTNIQQALNNFVNNAHIKSNIDTNTTLLSVGNIDDSGDIENCLLILKDGRVKVASAPQEDDDVVRLSDVQDIASSNGITTTIDAEFFNSLYC